LRENVSELESVVQSLRQELLIKEKQLSQVEHERYQTEIHVKDSKSLAEKRAEKLEEQIDLITKQNQETINQLKRDFEMRLEQAESQNQDRQAMLSL
jgi:ribonuclease HII